MVGCLTARRGPLPRDGGARWPQYGDQSGRNVADIVVDNGRHTAFALHEVQRPHRFLQVALETAAVAVIAAHASQRRKFERTA